MAFNSQQNQSEHRDYYKEYLLQEKKQRGCLQSMIKIGFGFVFGVAFTLFILEANHIDTIFSDTEKVIKESRTDFPPKDSAAVVPKQKGVDYFQVRSKTKHATIHTGMPKDSVILLLGQPTEFTKNSYKDEIIYRYGNYDFNSLRIEFTKGKVSAVSQN